MEYQDEFTDVDVDVDVELKIPPVVVGPADVSPHLFCREMYERIARGPDNRILNPGTFHC